MRRKTDPKAILEELATRQVDPNSTAAREMLEEIAERVLRNLTPQEEPIFSLKAKASEL